MEKAILIDQAEVEECPFRQSVRRAFMHPGILIPRILDDLSVPQVSRLVGEKMKQMKHPFWRFLLPCPTFDAELDESGESSSAARVAGRIARLVVKQNRWTLGELDAESPGVEGEQPGKHAAGLRLQPVGKARIDDRDHLPSGDRLDGSEVDVGPLAVAIGPVDRGGMPPALDDDRVIRWRNEVK